MDAKSGLLAMTVGNETLTFDPADFRPPVGSPIVVLTNGGSIERSVMLGHRDNSTAFGFGAERQGYLSEVQTAFGLEREICVVLGRIVEPVHA